jgi:hemoglobin
VKNDIRTRSDIEQMVNSFYEKVKADALIGYIFNDVARVDWPAHLPRMYAFWASLLLNEEGFSGNPMEKHITLAKITALGQKEFDRWLELFASTVDELFEGEKANEAKVKANNIARLMLFKIQNRNGFFGQ